MKILHAAALACLLIGCSKEEAPPPPPKPSSPPPAADLGMELYSRHCASCHGWEARASAPSMDLRYSGGEVYANWDSIVLEGELAEAGMPSFADLITVEESDLIKEYVLRKRREALD